VLKTVVALALVWALAGCGGAQMPTLKTQALLDGKVQIGMSRLDVEKDLGVNAAVIGSQRAIGTGSH